MERRTKVFLATGALFALGGCHSLPRGQSKLKLSLYHNDRQAAMGYDDKTGMQYNANLCFRGVNRGKKVIMGFVEPEAVCPITSIKVLKGQLFDQSNFLQQADLACNAVTSQAEIRTRCGLIAVTVIGSGPARLYGASVEVK
jgi:hypothetical protein